MLSVLLGFRFFAAGLVLVLLSAHLGFRFFAARHVCVIIVDAAAGSCMHFQWLLVS